MQPGTDVFSAADEWIVEPLTGRADGYLFRTWAGAEVELHRRPVPLKESLALTLRGSSGRSPEQELDVVVDGSPRLHVHRGPATGNRFDLTLTSSEGAPLGHGRGRTRRTLLGEIRLSDADGVDEVRMHGTLRVRWRLEDPAGGGLGTVIVAIPQDPKSRGTHHRVRFERRASPLQRALVVAGFASWELR